MPRHTNFTENKIVMTVAVTPGQRALLEKLVDSGFAASFSEIVRMCLNTYLLDLLKSYEIFKLTNTDFKEIINILR